MKKYVLRKYDKGCTNNPDVIYCDTREECEQVKKDIRYNEYWDEAEWSDITISHKPEKVDLIYNDHDIVHFIVDYDDDRYDETYEYDTYEDCMRAIDEFMHDPHVKTFFAYNVTSNQRTFF